jgi:hypothetical protein
MFRKLIAFIILILFVSLTLRSQETGKDIRLRNLVKEYSQADVSIPYPGPREMDLLTRNVSITSVRNKTVFISISTLSIDWFIRAKFDYTILEKAVSKGIISSGSVTEAMDWQSYPTYPQYLSMMQGFASTYPSLCHLDTIGTSINGRYVLALKISDNAAIKEDEPEVFYSSSMHGDELGGFVLMLRLADYLLSNYNLNSRVKTLVDNLEIWINPLANPDGAYTSGNTITSPVRYNANGYDLNRNFPDPLNPYNTSNIEQKETIDMVSFMRKHHFVISANFHSGTEVVNYPWDKWPRLHADNTWFFGISRAYVDTVHKYSVPVYMDYLNNGVTNGYAWYSVYGGRQDFITWTLQGREVTIELDNITPTPAAQLELLWQNNWHSLLVYFENALYGIHGVVKDSNTEGPLHTRVFISGHDIDSSQVYSDSLTGRFIRLIAPGTWNLTFSAPGYRDTTIFNVTVAAGQRTDLTVLMKSIATGVIDTTNPKAPLLYPDPASSYLMARLPDKLNGLINIKIFSQAGIKVADYNMNFIFGYPLKMDIDNLSAGGYIIIFTNISSGVTSRGRFIKIAKFI